MFKKPSGKKTKTLVVCLAKKKENWGKGEGGREGGEMSRGGGGREKEVRNLSLFLQVPMETNRYKHVLSLSHCGCEREGCGSSM